MGHEISFRSYMPEHKGRSNRLPLVELLGRRRVLVENHHGILFYGTNEIGIRVCFGCLYVQGKDLKIRRICKEKLVISGIVDGVQIQGGDCNGTY